MKQTTTYLIALAAIVLIVGIVVLVTNIQEGSQPIQVTEEDVVGEAFEIGDSLFESSWDNRNQEDEVE